MKLSYQGLVDRYEDAAFPTFDLKAWVEPLPVNYANTKHLMLLGYQDAVANKISIDMGNVLVHSNDIGDESIYIKDRAAKGSIMIRSPLQSEFDIYAAVRHAVTGPLLFTHGPIGNQSALFQKTVQLLNPSNSEKDGIKQTTLELNVPPNGSGNNEVVFILQ